MLPRHVILPAILILAFLTSIVSISKAQSGARGIDCQDSLARDIPIQSDSTGDVLGALERQAVLLVRAAIEGDGKSRWTHLLVGLFGSPKTAARCGRWLTARDTADVATIYAAEDLPVIRTSRWPGSIAELAPGFDPDSIPRPDPTLTALNDLVPRKPREDGGLWVRGDFDAAISTLQWIVGEENSDVISVESDGRVTLNTGALLWLSRADRVRSGQDLVVADYLKSNEGLYLVTQLTRASSRYCLYIGHRLPTAGGDVPLPGSINLDNNFDRRLNPYRKNGIKLALERPPDGFDAISGINPIAVWFNIDSDRLVPEAMIVFHELAEALAKVEYGLEYLPVGLRPGAHDIALERELKLSSQRRRAGVITTTGSNRVFENEKGFLEFKADMHEARSGR